MVNDTVVGAPDNSLGRFTEKGWMTSEAFVEVLEHFKAHTRPSIENPVLLLLDNHSSHCSYEAMRFAKTNHISLLTFPPHLTHRMQPLDVGVYGPMKRALVEAIKDASVTADNELEGVDLVKMPKISREPFYCAFTIKNIKSAFEATGLWELNSLKFKDIIEPTISESTTSKPTTSTPTIQDSLNESLWDDYIYEDSRARNSVPDDCLFVPALQPDVSPLASSSEPSISSLVALSESKSSNNRSISMERLEEIQPIVKIAQKKSRRAEQNSTCLTSTPEMEKKAAMVKRKAKIQSKKMNSANVKSKKSLFTSKIKSVKLKKTLGKLKKSFTNNEPRYG